MIKEAICQLLDRKDLPLETAMLVMREIMTGQATNAQIASFLTAMRLKGESVDEITACVHIMRQCCAKFDTQGDLMDIVGTGGDQTFTFNISTVSSFVISAAGIPVAKHGNRSVSSKCGSADLLEALGVNIELSAERSAAILKKTGLCFMYAPTYHTSMKYAAPVRKELGVRTIFNILGPLANPAGANLQLLGVYDENLVEPLARVLRNLGVKRAMVVHGHDGLDEVSLTSSTTVCEVNGNSINSFFFDPRQFGFNFCQPEDIRGGDARENAAIARAILEGERGPRRDIVLLNSALCIYMAKNNITLRECIKIAADMIDSKKALAQLTALTILSREAAA